MGRPAIHPDHDAVDVFRRRGGGRGDGAGPQEVAEAEAQRATEGPICRKSRRETPAQLW